MNWHFRSDQPIYTQLVNQITLAVLSGGFSPGERLPGVRDLAAQAGVNPNTMQRALTQLEQSGLLYTQRTAGRFVTEDTAVIAAMKEQLARQRMTEFLHSMAELGYDHTQVQQLFLQTQTQEEQA